MKSAAVRQDESVESLVAGVVDEFRQRQQQGEQPDIEEYAARYPQAAELLRKVLASWQLMSLSGAGDRAGSEGQVVGLLGDFRIVREVGRGGMGIVYEAEQVSLGRRVALKVLPFAATMDPRQLQRFHNEARAAAGLHHTNIVPVYAVGSERGVHYYAMQFIDGRTLAQFVAEQRREAVAQVRTTDEADAAARSATTPAPAAQATSTAPRDAAYYRRVAEWGIQAAEALDCAHSFGVIHRDIKPANLIVDETGRLWVTDFGLAQVQSDTRLTMTGDLVGTLRYMSPEQALAKRVVVDHRTDVYSLGATLYEMLSLEPAYRGHDRQELLRQIAFEEPRAPRRINRAIPVELETIVLKALEKNPVDRYATAGELADDLRHWLEDRPIQARRPSLRQVAAKWARRHRSAVWAAAVVLLMVALVEGSNVLWWLKKCTQAETEARVELNEAIRLQEQQKWPEAAGAIRRAHGILVGVWANATLCRQVGERVIDLAMARRLEEARLRGAAFKDGHFDKEGTCKAYAEAFAWYGLDVDESDPTQAGEFIQGRSIMLQLAAALDDWAVEVKDSKRRGQRLAISRLADPDPWRNRLRETLERNDGKALKELAATARGDELPPVTVVLLARFALAKAAAEHVVMVLRQAQQRHPNDFWINHELGNCLRRLGPARLEEALRYYTAAVALRPQSPGARLDLGVALAEQGKMEEARVCFQQAIQLDPRLAKAHSNIGLILYRQGKVEEAIAWYHTAIVLDPTDANTHDNLGIALKAQGKVKEAIACYHQAIALNPRHAKAHNNLGVALFDQGKVEAAIACYDRAIAFAPRLAKAHNNLGSALKSQGKLEQAIACFNRTIALDPTDAKAHFNLGVALEDQRKVDESVACYRRAIACDSKFARAHNNLGAALARQGKVNEAIACYREAVACDPTLTHAHNSLGTALAGQGKLEEAIACFHRAIALDPRLAKAHNNLGGVLASQGKFEQAIACYRHAIALDPSNAGAHDNLGLALAAQGNLEQAVAYFRQAIALDPSHARAHNNVGTALARQGKVDAAIAYFHQAVKLDPKFATAHRNLGAALAEQGKAEQAIACFRQAIALDARDAEAHFNLGLALYRQGKVEEAIGCYRQAITLVPGHAKAHCNLGGALRQQGRFTESLASFRRGHELGSKTPGWPCPSALWVRQARRLVELDGKLPAFLKGDLKPKGAAEQIELAAMCSLKRWYAASARFYADAFAAGAPKAAEERARHRYSAACTAALAGCGRGEDAPAPDEQQRARLRQQALAWLRDELTFRATQIASTHPGDQATAQRFLQHWQTNRNLAGLRGEALARLSEAEREAWGQLWTDLADTLARALAQEKSGRK
jgi:superkiller protein 3